MMKDIHDITPPVQVGIDPAIIKYALIGLAVISALAIAYFIFKHFFQKKQKQNTDMLLLPPPLPPDEAAFKELELLRDLMTIDPRLFCFEISKIFKTYIGKQFKINAPEMTTQELIINLNGLDIDKKTAADAKAFLLSLDDIKYAGLTPSIDKMDHDYDFVKKFVQSVSRKDNNNDKCLQQGD